MKITTHVLDTSRGLPASHLSVGLEYFRDAQWTLLSSSRTDADGRVSDWPESFGQGRYRIVFDTESYFGSDRCFYPSVVVTFDIKDTSRHYHVPLLIAPYGYTTYRGS